MVMNRILSYGSLREGDYNFDRMKDMFGNKGIKRLDTFILSNYRIYNLGHYPGLNKSNNELDKVTFDLLEVSDECMDFIRRMERGAGYTEELIKEYNALLFVYDTDLGKYKDTEFISSGDWLKYLKQKELV